MHNLKLKHLALVAALALSPTSSAQGRASLFHLLWLRRVFLDMTGRIDGDTLIGLNQHELA